MEDLSIKKHHSFFQDTHHTPFVSSSMYYYPKLLVMFFKFSISSTTKFRAVLMPMCYHACGAK